MKIDMLYYIRACEITGEDYEVTGNKEEKEVMLFRDIDNIIYDLVDKYDELEKKYLELQNEEEE